MNNRIYCVGPAVAVNASTCLSSTPYWETSTVLDSSVLKSHWRCPLCYLEYRALNKQRNRALIMYKFSLGSDHEYEAKIKTIKNRFSISTKAVIEVLLSVKLKK